jgi:flavin-dependent thymidylate synthase
MATVTLLDYTGKGSSDALYAAKLLAYTKNTRLKMTPEGFDAFMNKSEEEIRKEIDYMSTTIASSLEFADVTFLIQDVSRACAQQITRTRNASYQMQSQRVTDMSEVGVVMPETVKNKNVYAASVRGVLEAYKTSVGIGESLEDARGLLPMNTCCNLMAKYNLRSVVDLLRARDSMRVQGEYRDIAVQMKAEILKVWPWSEPFFRPKEEKAIGLIESVAARLSGEDKILLAKAADLIKKG